MKNWTREIVSLIWIIDRLDTNSQPSRLVRLYIPAAFSFCPRVQATATPDFKDIVLAKSSHPSNGTTRTCIRLFFSRYSSVENTEKWKSCLHRISDSLLFVYFNCSDTRGNSVDFCCCCCCMRVMRIYWILCGKETKKKAKKKNHFNSYYLSAGENCMNVAGRPDSSGLGVRIFDWQTNKITCEINT